MVKVRLWGREAFPVSFSFRLFNTVDKICWWLDLKVATDVPTEPQPLPWQTWSLDKAIKDCSCDRTRPVFVFRTRIRLNLKARQIGKKTRRSKSRSIDLATFFRKGHSWPLFSLFSSFQYLQLTVNMFIINSFVDDWILTADLRHRKRPLCQLSYNYWLWG